jgi:hypothetical protein
MRNDSFPPIEYTVSSDQMLILKNKRMGEWSRENVQYVSYIIVHGSCIYVHILAKEKPHKVVTNEIWIFLLSLSYIE